MTTLRELFAIDQPVNDLLIEYEQDLKHKYGTIEPTSGARRLVAAAANAGVRLVLVTSAPRSLAQVFLAGADLDHAFVGIVSGEDGPVKPDPAPYLSALDRAGVQADCALAVEDAPAGVRSAVAAGILVVGVSASSERAAALRAAGAGFVFADLHELRAALGLGA